MAIPEGKDSEIQPEDTVTIIEDYHKDEKGVWYRWRFPNEEKWHVKLTGMTDLPYVRFVTMSKAEFKEKYENPDLLLSPTLEPPRGEDA